MANSNGKRARAESGLNRYEITRASRKKRHEALRKGVSYDASKGTNARKAAQR